MDFAPNVQNEQRLKVLQYANALREYLDGLPKKRMFVESALRSHWLGSLPAGISIEDVVAAFPNYFYVQAHARSLRRDEIVLKSPFHQVPQLLQSAGSSSSVASESKMTNSALADGNESAYNGPSKKAKAESDHNISRNSQALPVLTSKPPEQQPTLLRSRHDYLHHQGDADELITSISSLAAQLGCETLANHFHSLYDLYFTQSFDSVFPGEKMKTVLQRAEEAGACRLVTRGCQLFVGEAKSPKELSIQQRLGQRPSSVLDRVGSRIQADQPDVDVRRTQKCKKNSDQGNGQHQSWTEQGRKFKAISYM
jgi:hypothetical protein